MTPTLILRTSAPLILAVAVAVSLYILLRGHNAPGGGFIGGLIAAAGIAFYAISCGKSAALRLLRISPAALCGAGLALAAISGTIGLLTPDAAFLTHSWWALEGGSFAIGTTLPFDLGVYLAVVGTVSAFLLVLAEN